MKWVNNENWNNGVSNEITEQLIKNKACIIIVWSKKMPSIARPRSLGQGYLNLCFHSDFKKK